MLEVFWQYIQQYPHGNFFKLNVGFFYYKESSLVSATGQKRHRSAPTAKKSSIKHRCDDVSLATHGKITLQLFCPQRERLPPPKKAAKI